MTVRVLKTFRDIHTGELHKAGDTFDCTAKRMAEIEKVGHFVEKVNKKKEVEAE